MVSNAAGGTLHHCNSQRYGCLGATCAQWLIKNELARFGAQCRDHNGVNIDAVRYIDVSASLTLNAFYHEGTEEFAGKASSLWKTEVHTPDLLISRYSCQLAL